MGNILTLDYFDSWKSMLTLDIEAYFNDVKRLELEPHSFTFYTSISVMSSSRIEGEPLELDSYVKHKLLDIEYLPELTQKPNDLYNAYLFARGNELNKQHILAAHQLIAAHLLPQSQRGQTRNTEMLVMEHKTGRIQYEACPKAFVGQHFDSLCDEVNQLMDAELTIEQVFYYAALIHLVFVNIHPFADGNGRLSRLIEKWFLVQKLGERAWFIKSEKYYYNHVGDYYKNLARLGMFFEELDYMKSIPFLLMLPESLTFET